MNVVVIQETVENWRWFADGQTGDRVSRDTPAVEIAARLRVFVRQLAADGVFLAVASQHVQNAAFSFETSKRSPDQQELVYQLEHQIPLVAEQMAADFVWGNEQALGIAVDGQRYQTLVQAIEQVGLKISGIAPKRRQVS